MEKRAIITIGLILFLSAVIAIKNMGCGNKVPALEGWYEPADEIDIKGRDTSLTMVKKDSIWYLNEQAYPGDADLIESLERKVRDFKLLDLVSENGYYDKYDLTEEKGISVTIKGKGKVLRKLLIGKAGSTNNHSYIRVDDRKEIYLATGIMKNDFSLPVSDLRNKVIFNVKKDDIKSFSIKYNGRKFDFELITIKSETAGSSKSETRWLCRSYENIKLNDSSINSILAVFSPLRAAEFPENKERKNAGNSICEVTINNGDKKIDLLIYSNKDKDMNFAWSSESKYIFTVGSWQTEKLFIKNISDLAVK